MDRDKIDSVMPGGPTAMVGSLGLDSRSYGGIRMDRNAVGYAHLTVYLGYMTNNEVAEIVRRIEGS